MRSKNKLAKNTVVGTVMSNMGLDEFLGRNSINFVSSKVGDKYVLRDMLDGGFNLGGEQSGHIIFLDHATTGDGQLTAIKLLSIIKDYKEPFSKIASILTKYPQVMVNVEVCAEGKKRLDEDSIVQSEIKKVESELSGKKEAGNSHKEGRVLVRASGTEPLIRVMLEGKDLSKIKKNRVVATVCYLMKNPSFENLKVLGKIFKEIDFKSDFVFIVIKTLALKWYYWNVLHDDRPIKV